MTNIEDRTKYEEEYAVKLPDKLSAYCNLCKEEKTFEFLGIQKVRVGKDLALYNCTGCVGTKAYSTLIEQFNGRAID